MKIVVIGGSGFLGSHVADILTEAGHNVTIFDRQASSYLQKNQEMVIGDTLDANAVNKVTEGADYVYHFAGIADLDHATTQPMNTVTQNIQGTVVVLEACVKNKIKRILFASSVYVYSSKGGFYRCSKQSAELYVEEYQRRYGLDFSILRYGTLYGPRADESNSVYRYLNQALSEGVIECTAIGDEMREYIYVQDAARLSMDVLAKEHVNKHVVITGHHPMKFMDFLGMINEMLGSKVDIRLNNPKADSDHYSMTPYSFTPKISYKLTSNSYLDIGQGLLSCMNDISSRQNMSTKR